MTNTRLILLNLVLSCIAAVQAAGSIMMSQNRQEAKDRQRAENDYKINLKSELIIDDLHKKLDLVLETKRRSTAAWIRLKRRLRRKTRKNNALHIKIWEIVLKSITIRKGTTADIPAVLERKSRCTRCGFGASAFCCLSISNFTLLRSKAYGHYRGLCRRLA